ncbi:cytochrome b/b6 domain-containing protein [Laribacter hongkongensis]|uniref:Cytochrome b/b6 domain-containing protein n=1 Tax=Laribacter hongkongensis TaxID=168471 RepID=A0ABD4SPP1_9NEIS|nr:cytochrome b/b6 domain-containing protein [Laribacter hongkongensis]MCG9025151.1 cytochrome b/b6 domain-containing protein [Laribacter hongkongensis]
MKMRVFVWDLPTRLFHWTLVLTFAGLWYSGTQGGEMLQYHIWLGYGMATLLLFRLIWGVLGSQTARFVQFVRGPASMLDYARGQLPEEKIPGHNPMGGMMVMLLLALLIAQVLTGLFAADIDSYAYDGPLVHLVDAEQAEAITLWHKALVNVLLGAVALHLSAIVFYALVKRQNLVGPMLTGYKSFEREVGKLDFTPGIIALVSLIVSAGAIYTLVTRL